MSVIDRHVLGQWLRALALMLVALVGLLVLVDVQKNLGDFVQGGGGFSEVIYYYLLFVPGSLPLVLPISVLLSLLLALGQLHRNSEFTALRTAGLGLLRITRSVWVFGLFLAGLVGYLNASLIPWTVEQAREVSEGIRQAARQRRAADDKAGLITGVGFANPVAGRIWFFNRFSETGRRGYGVTLGILDGNGREVRRLAAKEACFDVATRQWVFLQGRTLRLDPRNGGLLEPGWFDRHVEPGVDDDPEFMLLLRKPPTELSLFELRRAIEHLRREDVARVRRYEVEYERKRSSPFGVLIVMALAIPFAVSGVRVNPAVNIAKSIGLFFAYFLLVRLSTLMGSFGSIPPLAAAWLPDAAMLAVALWFFRKLV